MARFLVTLISLVSLNAVFATAEPSRKDAGASVDSRYLLSACDIAAPENDCGISDAEPGCPGRPSAACLAAASRILQIPEPAPVAGIRRNHPIRAPPATLGKT